MRDWTRFSRTRAGRSTVAGFGVSVVTSLLLSCVEDLIEAGDQLPDVGAVEPFEVALDLAPRIAAEFERVAKHLVHELHERIGRQLQIADVLADPGDLRVGGLLRPPAALH